MGRAWMKTGSLVPGAIVHGCVDVFGMCCSDDEFDGLLSRRRENARAVLYGEVALREARLKHGPYGRLSNDARKWA